MCESRAHEWNSVDKTSMDLDLHFVGTLGRVEFQVEVVNFFQFLLVEELWRRPEKVELEKCGMLYRLNWDEIPHVTEFSAWDR